MPPKVQPTVTRLLDRHYVYRGRIYEQGIAEVPADFPHGTPVGASAAGGAALSAKAAKLLVGLDDEQLSAALELRGHAVHEGATREQMLAMVGLGSAPDADALAAEDAVAAAQRAQAKTHATAGVKQVADEGGVPAPAPTPAPAPAPSVRPPAHTDPGAPQVMAESAAEASSGAVGESVSEYEAMDKADLAELVEKRLAAGETVLVTPTGVQDRPKKSDYVAALLAADLAAGATASGAAGTGA